MSEAGRDGLLRRGAVRLPAIAPAFRLRHAYDVGALQSLSVHGNLRFAIHAALRQDHAMAISQKRNGAAELLWCESSHDATLNVRANCGNQGKVLREFTKTSRDIARLLFPSERGFLA